MKNYFGRKVAVDASMCIYQFLIAVRQEGNMLTNAEGETTSHIMGMFYRTIRMIENGLKPVYVFDGKPPEMKSGELEKRTERRVEAEEALKKAEEAEDTENIDKFSKRLVKVTKQHNEDCKDLLQLMGVPYVDAPGEAEAQCSALVKAGKVYAVGTEDMDSLTFGGDVLLRHLTFSEARKMPIQEFNLQRVLQGLEMNMEQFIDLCILLGCDYVPSIRGVGPKKAIEMMRREGSIEGVLRNLDKKKYGVPENWLFAEARELFRKPLVTDPDTINLKWTEPDEDALVEFMVTKHGFSEERVRSGARKLTKSRQGAQQGRIDSFFTSTPSTAAPAGKRKSVDSSAGKRGGLASKRGRGGGSGFKRGK